MDLQRYNPEKVRVQKAEQPKPSLLERLLFSLSPRSEEIDAVLNENDEIIAENVRHQADLLRDVLMNVFGTPVVRDFKGRDYQLR